MRITGGALKGRAVGSRKIFGSRAKTEELRPTPAKVREALFNILRQEIEGAVFLDLYAGSGAIGIEALSRGASRLISVEKSRKRCRAIAETLRTIGQEAQAEVHEEAAEDYLRRAGRMSERIDVVFADPPYGSDEIDRILPLLDRLAAAADERFLVVMEHTARKHLPAESGLLGIGKQYRYGDTMLTVYRKAS